MKKCIIIPARGGSKGIPRKNLYLLLGFPLIYYPITAGKASSIDDIWVSSDDNEILNYSKSIGANIQQRPYEISQDLSTDLEVFQYFLNNIENKYDYIVHLRATFPKITPDIIDNACYTFEKNYDKIDSMRSVIQVTENPYKMWQINKNNLLSPVIQNNKLHSAPRQIIPITYLQNACIDIIKTSTICNLKSIIGNKCMSYVMNQDFNFDIDTIQDISKRSW